MTGRAPSFTIDGFDQLVEIGRGGSATVYRARQIAFDRAVAIKVLHPIDGVASTRRRLERECVALGALADVAGVVTAHAVVQTSDGRGAVVMRLMEESAATRLRRTGPLPVGETLRIGGVVARALAAAHERGIVHRDVKPANILISGDGDVAIADFDIAATDQTVSATRTRDALTPAHTAPERLGGEDDGTPAGDVWSLGSTLYALLTGRAPFGDTNDAGGLAGLVDRVMYDPAPPIGRSEVGRDVEAVIERALAKDPADRWPDMASFAEALGSVSRAPGHVDPAPRSDGETGPWWAPLVIAAAVVTSLGTAALIAFG